MLYDRLDAIGMAEPGAELARDVVACPGADTCNLAVTQSRGLADAIGDRARGGRAWPRSAASASTSRAAPTPAASTTSPTSASSAPSAGPTAGRRPGYQMLLGGYVGEEQIHFGEKALRLPAKAAPEAAVRVVRRFADEREAGETFRGWLDRSGGAKAIAADPQGPRRVPRRPRSTPSSTSTTTRPAPTRPRSATRSAPREADPDVPRARTIGARWSPTPTRSSPSSTPSSRRLPGVEDHPVGRRQLRPAPVALRASMQDAVLIDLATKVDPGHRGRVHRHRLPLPRDARDRRGGPAPLRPEPPDHDGRPSAEELWKARPRELLLGGEGRPARPRPRRQGRLDVAACAATRPTAGPAPRSSPATCAAW